MKMIKKIMLLTATFLNMGLMVGCDSKDISNSNGAYTINVPGYEDERKETIFVTGSNASLQATVSGKIYYLDKDETYSFDTQERELKKYEGSVWYMKVYCTDGYYRTIFVIRNGSNQIGSVGVDVSVLGCGGGISFPVYDEYTSVNYLMYAGYSYLKP